MKRTTATRLASKLEAMGDILTLRLVHGNHDIHYSPAALRDERDTLLKASVELRRLAAKKGKKQSKVGAL